MGIEKTQKPPAIKGQTASQHAGKTKGAQDAKNPLVLLKVKLVKETAELTKDAADILANKRIKKDPYCLTEGVTPFSL